MLDTDGWQVVDEYLKQRIQDHKDQLMSCDIEDVVKHRAKAEALRSVLLYLQDIIDEGQQEVKKDS